MIRDDFSGGKPWANYYAHGDPFPLAPSWIENCLEEKGVAFPRRGVWTAKALNNLAMHDPNSDFDKLLRGKPPNSAQRSVAQRVVSAFEEAGMPPDELDGGRAVEELVGTQDLYHGEPSTLAPYSFEKVKVLHSELAPRDLSSVVPRFVQGIIQRYDSLVERSASELAEVGPCPVKPYWDPGLRASPKEMKRLIVGLAQKGLVTFRTGIKEKIGIFCVRKKTPEWVRLIIDARRANWAHRPPPCTRLATPRSLLDLQFKRRTDGGPCAYGMEADVADCFYNFVCESTASWFGVDLPLPCEEWQRLGWGGGPIYSDASKSFFTPDKHEILFPVFRGLCMGWSWALFFANEAVAFITSGRLERPLSEVRDRLPAPEVGANAVTGVYVDNISIIGPSVQAVVATRDRIKTAFAELGIPLTWSAEEPSAVLETIGVVFDFQRGIARNKPRRIWRAFMAGKEFLRRRRVSCRILEIWLGHMTALFMIAPQALSCFFHIYKFVQKFRGKRAELWPSVREEIKMALGMVWLCRATLVFDPIVQVDAGDSSNSAFALMTTEAGPGEIAEACRWREVWRFRPLAEEVKKVAESGSRAHVLEVLDALRSESLGPLREQELRPSAQFGAGLRTQFAAWLAEASNPDSWLRTSAISSQLRAKPCKRSMVEVPAMVPPLEMNLVRRDRYHLLWRKRWRNKEDAHITLKEARVALSSLKRTSRSAGLHGRWKLTLTDNLSCLAAFERGRATNFALNQLCRTAAAYAMSCGIRWRLRHVETKRNPADHDSRFDQKRPAATYGHDASLFPFDRGKKDKPSVGRASEGNPLPSSSMSVRGLSTAIPGRGGTNGAQTAHGSPKTRQTASQRLAQKIGGGNVGGFRAMQQTARPVESGPEVSPQPRKPTSPAPRPGGLFLEIFSGSGRLTAAVKSLEAAVLSPVELKLGGHFDMRRRTSQETVLSWVRSGRVAYLHLGTPCTVFSRARHNIVHRQRAEEKERVGLELALFSIELIVACIRYGVKWSLENPRSSRLFDLPVLAQLLQRSDVIKVNLDFCRYMEHYKKPTTIYTNFLELRKLEKQCNHKKHAVVLRGSEVVTEGDRRQSVPKTRAAGAYPLALVEKWAQDISSVVSRASRDSELLDLQWQDELKKCVPKRFFPGQQTPSSPTKLFRVEALGQAKGFVVFGQHTSEEAAQRETKLHQNENIRRFETVTGLKDPQSLAKTPTAAGTQGP